MVAFRKKKIIYVKSLGEDLEKARIAEHLSYLAIEKKIGIRKEYLESMDNGDWAVIPGEIYARVFLKKYSNFLGLEWAKIKAKFEKEIEGGSYWVKNDTNKMQWIQRVRLIVMTKIIKNILLILAAAMVAIYVGYQLWHLVRPPELEILYPQVNFVGSSELVKILGKIDKNAVVFFNGQEIVPEEDGFFIVDINLKKGLNIVKFETRKKYGRMSTMYKEIIID